MFNSRVQSYFSCLTAGTSLFSLVQNGVVSAAANDKDLANLNRSGEIAFDGKKATEPAVIDAIGEDQLETRFGSEKFGSENEEPVSGNNTVSNKKDSKKGAEAEKLSGLQHDRGIVCFTAKALENKEDREINFLFSILIFILLLPFRLAFSLIWSIITSILVTLVGLPLMAVFCVLTFLIDGSDDTFLVKSKRSLVFMCNFLVSLVQGIRNGNLGESFKSFSDNEYPKEYSGFVGRSVDKLKNFFNQNVSKFF